MSREFGDYSGGGYFHNKISAALEDARGGNTAGAKLMAFILEPLAKMAFAVSSEEACDAGEDSTTLAFFEALPDLENAIRGIRHHTDPARMVAANTLAKVIGKNAVVESKGNGEWSVRVMIDSDVESKATFEVRNEAIVEIVRQASGKGSLSWAGCSYASNFREATHHVREWDARDKSYLLGKIRKLEERIAFLEAVGKEKEPVQS